MRTVSSVGNVGRGNGGSGEAGGHPRGGRSALISDLVAKLKRGDITKAELFSKLQQLQEPTSILGPGLTSDGAGTDAATPANLVGGKGVSWVGPIVTSAATSSSGDSSIVAAGMVTAAAAGFFSANDRQAIIQKIADERRRRAEEARNSWRPHGKVASPRPASGGLSSSFVQSSPIVADTSTTSQSSGEAQNRYRNSRLRQPVYRSFSSASLHALPASDRGAERSTLTSQVEIGQAGVALATYSRQGAWVGGEGQQQAPYDIQPNGGHHAPADDHAFPRAEGQHRSLSSEMGYRRGPIGAESSNGCVGVEGGRRGGGSGTRGTESAGTRTFSPSTNRDDPAAICDPSINGPDRLSRSSGSSVQHDVKHASPTRRRGVGDVGGGGGGNDRDEAERNHLPIFRKSFSATNSHGSTSKTALRFDQSITHKEKADSFGHESPRVSLLPRTESWITGQGEGGGARGEGGGSWVHGSYKEISGATDKQTPDARPTGQGGWVEGLDAWGEDGASGEAATEHPLRGEGEGMSGTGSGGGGDRGRKRATEMMVDEDAYRFRSFSEERARRGEELVRRELMNECTFRPKIKGLPQSYGATNNDDTPFLQRVTQWQRDKEKDADARKAVGKDKELQECTFTPRVNSVSRRAARNRRQSLGENHLAVDDRLYDESIRREMDRSQLAAEQAARAEERLLQECTFSPDLATQRAAAVAAPASGDAESNGMMSWGYTVPRGRSRYRQAAAAVAAAAVASGAGGGSGVWGAGRRANGARAAGSKTLHWELESCTFRPNVIGVRKGMDQAKQYLQYDVVERLTGAAFRHDDTEEYDNESGSEEGEALVKEGGGTLRGVMQRSGFGDISGIGMGRDGLGYSSAWDSGDGDKLEFDSAGRGDQPQRSRQKGGAGSAASSSFHAFLARQNKMETDKLKHIKEVQMMRQHTFRPEICPESMKIHQESNKGDFLQRVARDAARKEHETVRQKAAGLHDPDCTFKPQITARSATLQARSVVELSRGDQLRRETTQRLTRLRVEQELLAGTTFRPRINADPASRMAVSKLRVVSDPGNYISTVESLRRRKEESAVRGAIEKAAKEIEGCTFRPEITVCPAYITRIARSISASKAMPAGGKKKQRPVKPEWR